MNVRGWVVYNKQDYDRNEAFVNWLLREAEHFPFDLQVVIKDDVQFGIKHHQLSILYRNANVQFPDFVIMRNIDPLFSTQMEQLGARVFNRSEIAEMCNHKGKTHQAIAALQIPMLDTIFVKRNEISEENIRFDYPIVVKEGNGRGGKQVYLIQNKKELEVVIQKVHTEDLVIQPLAKNYGKDIRVYVIGNEIVAAVKRESKDSFKSNYTLGGQATLYSLTEEEELLVQKIINSFSFDFVGIDFLLDEQNQLLFNEIEDVVGSRMLSNHSNINIVQRFFTHIEAEMAFLIEQK
ncbi:ATP-grasp domain-containing protein [Salirhabdus sp. Marseille-P4669]|uniref:ATP-grasp domain-containing protein n=1 Tax=Salirhabdus sp. Marseille-P4669 TaxID=2042310 RepID=UPI001359575B|nr:RimK family alpha-L-glutamate ligase [Salirhabdus sp. Marseille-P4669]